MFFLFRCLFHNNLNGSLGLWLRKSVFFFARASFSPPLLLHVQPSQICLRLEFSSPHNKQTRMFFILSAWCIVSSISRGAILFFCDSIYGVFGKVGKLFIVQFFQIFMFLGCLISNFCHFLFKLDFFLKALFNALRLCCSACRMFK